MKTLVFDLDGTLCTQPHPTEFDGAQPIRLRIAEVNRLYEAGHRIVIDTARGSRTGRDWRDLTERQLAEWGVRYHELRVGSKCGAEVYVDDRGVHPDTFFGGGPTLAARMRAAEDIAEFAGGYFDRLRSACASIDPNTIAALARELEDARSESATVWIVGNGGSASAAAHIANGLGGYLAHRCGAGFRVQSLAENAASLTGLANDAGFEEMFTAQLRAFWRAGDRLLAISCSGNSPNIVRAAEWVRQQGGRVIGMLGFDGGALRPLCHLALHVESVPGEYGPVEDAHMAVAHVLVHWYQRDREEVAA